MSNFESPSYSLVILGCFRVFLCVIGPAIGGVLDLNLCSGPVCTCLVDVRYHFMC